ncbi:hypothetical protein [Paraburkholderia sp. J12]|nr:hypothetical protein [Paraburkholderia sp. J12]
MAIDPQQVSVSEKAACRGAMRGTDDVIRAPVYAGFSRSIR